MYIHIFIYKSVLDLLPDKYRIKNCSKMFCTFFDFLGPKNPKKNFGIGRKQKFDFRITDNNG